MRNNTNPNQISLFEPVEDGGVHERERERGGGGRKTRRLSHIYNNIISVENLLVAWQEFLRGKRKRKDVIDFSLNLFDNILLLHNELSEKIYKHGQYHAFRISDPKQREIHKANVRDRLLHHAVYRLLYPYFDRKFIFDSYSCRKDKGTHRAINRFRTFGRKVSKNHTRITWVLKCDIKKFFASIDHKILINILKKHIADEDVIWLLKEIIDSFHTTKTGVGLPLGNLTSQLLINIFMNELDQYVKRDLKVKYYVRYADDFVILHDDKSYLINLIPKMSQFLENNLKLSLHPDKVFIKPLGSGVDFLGWVHFSYHRVLRTATKRRMFRRLQESCNDQTISSYLGLLKHGNTYKLVQKIKRILFANTA